MARPRILTTMSFDSGKYTLNGDYALAVTEAGGLPCLFTYDADLKDILTFADGLLLTGGYDLDPALFGEAADPRTENVIPERDAFELKACRLALEAGLPVLAVCRGLQALNVALGGTLIQHVDGHGFYDRKREPVHAAEAAEGSVIYGIFGGKFGVNSTHHQAVGRLGEGLIASARAADGVIEAAEAPEREFVVGVQWHPEALRINSAEHRSLFEQFVRAAGKRSVIYGI